jgi:5'(3')-deoxyribonucleotidase
MKNLNLIKKQIFVDLDGVVADWEKRAIEILGMDFNSTINYLKCGGDLEDICDIHFWEILDKKSELFWNELNLFPWAYEMIEKLQELGQVSFLSSGGNIYRRPVGVGNASFGKTLWISEKFREYNIPLILTKHKYFCAGSNSILIDDTPNKINEFVEYGGHGFLFPHPYKILDGDLKFDDVMTGLEEKILGLGK